MAYSGVAAAQYWRGEEQADSALERTASLARASGNILSGLWALEFRALLAAQQGDADGAERLVDQARTLAAEHALEAHWVHAAAHLALAHAHGARDERELARAEAERALELVRRGPARLELALALITLARLLPERAPGWLAEARRTIAACPDPGVLRAPIAAPARARAATRGDELSVRELRVLRLLTSRLTQREIGNELFVSQNTSRPTPAASIAS
jgi:LuxR family maltose regulon positive regulatory protein